jgi:hypothetical protein
LGGSDRLKRREYLVSRRDKEAIPFEDGNFPWLKSVLSEIG